MFTHQRLALGILILAASLGLVCPARAVVVIGDVYVAGASNYLPQYLPYPDPSVRFVRSIEVSARPGSSLVIGGELLDPGVSGGLGALSNEFRNFRARLDTRDPTFSFVNLIPPSFSWSPVEPNGWVTAYFGDFLLLNIARSASDTYQFAFDVVSDYYFREFDPLTREFGEWEFQGVESHGTVLVTLHVIPDAATLYLFGTGLALLSPLWLKRRCE